MMLKTIRFPILILLSLTTATGPLLAEPVPPGAVPVPLAKPFAAELARVPAPFAPPSGETTASIGRIDNPVAVSGSLKQGLDALAKGDAASARAIRQGMRAGTLDRHILTWAIALSGAKGVPSGEIAAAAQELAGWPGLEALRYQSEKALYRENPPAEQVLAAFGDTRPETAEGAIILTRALVATGNTRRAAQTISTLWRNETLDTGDEKRILGEFSNLLTKADHLHRMEMLLYRDRVSQAETASELCGAQSLFKAWASVIRGEDRAGALIAAVHPSWHDDPGYRFIRIMWLREKDRYEEAAKLLAGAPRDRAALINPGQWWDEQRIVSRGLIDQGDFRTAYRLAANHVATSSVDTVDAEFHAGWYALRGLNDAKTAARHFQNILTASNKPLSVSRAYYWLGRAAEAGGPGSAQDYYRRASAYPGTFYGQLASARLDSRRLDIRYPSPSAADRERFAAREPVQAIKRLEAAGYDWRADLIYRALAEQLDSPGELAILAAMAERRGDNHLSLQVGKIAYARGIDVPALAFPVGAIPDSANIDGSGKALAYAIARQESAFNKAAVSPANARGLLQLLPGTAKAVATRNGMRYSKDRLTEDAAYNATLGAHYLGEQISSFGGSYILTFIAYNAGPRRVPQWIARFGDPRGKPIDEVVDWIERIPFTETRNYVQRVMENYQVYKARLGQKPDIERDLRFGRSS